MSSSDRSNPHVVTAGAAARERRLGEVMLQLRQPLLRFIRARGAGADADDIFQELWIRLHDKRATEVADPPSYVFRCCDNLMIDLHRAEARRRQRDTLHAEPPESSLAPTDAHQQAEMRNQLALASGTLRKLGERTYAIFHRYRIDGVSQREIATELGISVSGVEKHLQKAYRALSALQRQFDAE